VSLAIRRELPLEDAADVHSRLVELLDRYEQSLFKFALVLAGDRDTASECAQEAFVRAYEQLQKGKSVNGGWLYTVARNLVMDEFRRRRRLVEESVLHLLPVQEFALDVRAGMREAFARLAPDDRTVLYLAAVEGRTAEEIATILGVRRGTVRMRICRARERFRLAYGGTP
jgi:RNA polymerase sigma-70 factor (ECF subfamily)